MSTKCLEEVNRLREDLPLYDKPKAPRRKLTVSGSVESPSKRNCDLRLEGDSTEENRVH